MKVHISYPPEPEDQSLLASLLTEGIELTYGEIQQAQPGTKIMVAGRPQQEELEALPELETLIVPWIGIPPETLELVREFPELSLHNLHHNADPTAEMAVALLLAAAKRIIPFDQALRSNDWSLRYQDPETILLTGKKALILGYGEVGRRIGAALRGFGLEVEFIRRSSQKGQEPDVYPLPYLDSALPETDFLILVLPLTEETQGLIGEKQLRLLPSSAVLVNVARGKIIEEAALYQALREKWIFAAGLDVWFNYPASPAERKSTPPGNYPWQELDNLVMSPHRGGLVRETETLRMRALAVLLNQAARGKAMDNKVDLDLGY